MSFNFLLPNHNSTFSFTLFYQESIHKNEAYFSLNISFPTLGLNPLGMSCLIELGIKYAPLTFSSIPFLFVNPYTLQVFSLVIQYYFIFILLGTQSHHIHSLLNIIAYIIFTHFLARSRPWVLTRNIFTWSLISCPLCLYIDGTLDSVPR